MSSVDSVFRTRSLGVPSIGLPDQYADGRAAKVWELYMGGKTSRTEAYKEWFIKTFKERNVKRVFDVACGTGIDSIMLLEAGYDVVSADASDKMLKSAFEERWSRRKEPAFDNWIVKEGNWLTMSKEQVEEEGIQANFDAVICCGNSFPHLPDFDGNQENHRLAIRNFYSLLKPGGILFIDHRNYDRILELGSVPPGPNVYYQGTFIKDIKCSNLYVDGKPTMITLDYVMDIHSVEPSILSKLQIDPAEQAAWKFRLSYYPHKLEKFNALLESVFGSDAKHSIYADFKPLSETTKPPAYYMHVIQKPAA